MLRFILFFLALMYSPFPCLLLVNNMMSRWSHFGFMSITTFLQAVVIYLEFQKRFPMVVYDDSDYDPSCALGSVYYVLCGINSFLIASIGFLSVIFLTSDFLFSIVVLQLISFLTILVVILYYLIYGFSYYSGYAYTEYRRRFNNHEIKQSVLPFSLPEEELQIYKKEYRFEIEEHAS